MISIILPTCNGEQYLAQSIESCLNQSHTDFELILVDDASTDTTPSILEAYAKKDARTRVFRHDTRKLLPGALNTGFSYARGDFLTWTSDDNCYRETALAELLSFLQSNPDIAVVYADYTHMDESGEILEPITVREPASMTYKSCVGPCFLYRREVYEIIGDYAEDLFLVEDYDYWLRVSMCFRLHPLHRDLYLYRLHPNSLTSKYRAQIMAAREQALLRSLPKLGWARPYDLAEGYWHMATLAQINGRPRDQLRYWGQAFRYSPLLISRKTILSGIARFYKKSAAQRLSQIYQTKIKK